MVLYGSISVDRFLTFQGKSGACGLQHRPHAGESIKGGIGFLAGRSNGGAGQTGTDLWSASSGHPHTLAKFTLRDELLLCVQIVDAR